MVTAKEIPPGGVGEVKVTFQSKGYQGNTKKSVTVESNDPENPRIRLSLGGQVVAEVTVLPRYVNFRNVPRDSPREPISLEIKLREGKGLKIREVSVDNPSVLLKELERKESGALYSVSLVEKVPTGRLTGKILIETNSKKSPTVQVPVYAFVEGRVKVSPQMISFGMIRPGESSVREIVMRGTGDAGFTIDRVDATSDGITTEVLPEEEGGGYRLSVTYDPGKKTKGRVSERLTIHVAGEEEETLEVPVYGTIREPPKKNP